MRGIQRENMRMWKPQSQHGNLRAKARGGENEEKLKVEEGEEEERISASGLSQLIKMGMGAISGDITEINLKDPKRTVVMELEANNFEDEEGNPISYVDNEGYVADKNEKTPLLNYVVPVLLGGGALAGVVFTLKALA